MFGPQKNINIPFLKPWSVPLPDESEQEEIESAFSMVDQKTRFASAKQQELQSLVWLLFQELITAKIHVYSADFCHCGFGGGK